MLKEVTHLRQSREPNEQLKTKQPGSRCVKYSSGMYTSCRHKKKLERHDCLFTIKIDYYFYKSHWLINVIKNSL